jgi:hypothetical protein
VNEINGQQFLAAFSRFQEALEAAVDSLLTVLYGGFREK